jgi:transcriptional regulator with XRE-family HTH domain
VDEVKRLRLEKGWSQNELAYHAKLAPSVISLIETGKRDPNASTLRKLANALEVRIPDLFEDSGTGKAGRRSPPSEPSFNDVLEGERQIAAARVFGDNLRHFTDKWREEIQDPQHQGVYWCAGVQATAIGLTELFGKLGYQKMIGRKIAEAGKQSPDGLIEEMKKGKSGRALSDPEFVAAMDLLKAFEDMHDVSDQVLEADETVDWITIREAEQRREAFRLIQGELSA